MNFSCATLATLQEANSKNHINGIENFLTTTCVATVNRRGYVKHRLSKFKGIFSSVSTVATEGKLKEKRISCFILKSVFCSTSLRL